MEYAFFTHTNYLFHFFILFWFFLIFIIKQNRPRNASLWQYLGLQMSDQPVIFVNSISYFTTSVNSKKTGCSFYPKSSIMAIKSRILPYTQEEIYS
ncbi:hypothetical protein AXX12_15430 [Anaerosporomusa subterranea]|uniref:Uncharacterized protein n=1 Tax=Anaerosporomusa subterranea TaxID=1794912 RepID=A0A154BLX0_ANASB|nr:hypothetical protein AXX12_15430 [Anaerosporomusa subterranea]